MRHKVQVFILLMVLLAFLCGFVCGFLWETPVDYSAGNSADYMLYARVCHTDSETELVSCMDSDGDVWDFYGADGWPYGSRCVMAMNSMGTADKTDDVIVSIIAVPAE